MTKSVVFDSFALIAFFKNEQGSAFISDVLSQLAFGEKDGAIPVINVGEIYYMLYRKASPSDAEKALNVLYTLPIKIVDAGVHLTIAAAKLKARFRISYADSFAAALTIANKATLITGDPEFRSLTKEKDFKVYFINR